MRDLVSNEIAVLLWWEGEMRHVGKSNTSWEYQIAIEKREQTDFSSVNPSVEREKAVYLQQSVPLRSRVCALRCYVYYLYIGTNDVI